MPGSSPGTLVDLTCRLPRHLNALGSWERIFKCHLLTVHAREGPEGRTFSVVMGPVGSARPSSTSHHDTARKTVWGQEMEWDWGVTGTQRE